MPVSLDAGIIYESTGYGYQEVEFSEKVSGDDILSFDGKKVFITGVGEEQFNSYIPFGDDKYSWVTFKAVVYALFDYTATGYSGTYDEQYHTIGGIDVFLPESGATVKYGTVEGTYDSYAPPSYKDPGTYPVYYQITAPDYYTETGSVNIEIKKRVYDVTWKNADGTLIDTTQVEEGDVPTHADATKAPDETYLYTFAGWTPEVSAVTGDAEYTAVFESAEKVAAVPAMINALPTEVTVNDKADIEAARAAYDSMTDEQKALIDEDTYKKLTDAETALAAAEEKAAADQAAAAAVIEAINAFPEYISIDDKEMIAAAREAYEALTPDQQALVNNADKLEEAEKNIADIEAAMVVADLIDALPEEITLDDKPAVEAARAAYEALTPDQKVELSIGSLLDLLDAVETIDHLEAAAVTEMINDLPAAADVTYDGKDEIEAARAVYDALTDDQKDLIDEDTLKKLTDAEDRINSYVLLGDADGDGEVTINDVTMIQKYIAGFEMPDNFVLKVCDTNCDGKITIDDATEIQKYVAEYEIPYPIGKMIAV